jgi:8-oxo-dGTP pyrophosphatase MutT (NUDIX family)
LEKERGRGYQSGEITLEKVKTGLFRNPGKVLSQNTDRSSSLLPKAAVAMIVHPKGTDGKLQVLLVKRVTREDDPWSGHMAFPGGRFVATDHGLLETVRREVKEEIGVDLKQLLILGTLDDLIAQTAPIIVTPFVILAENELKISLNPSEIDSFIWMPLSFFVDRKNVRPYRVYRLGQSVDLPSYRLPKDQIVWGMTLRIIEGFIQKLSQ